MASPNNNGSGAARMRALEGSTAAILGSWRERIVTAATMANLPMGLVSRLQRSLDDAVTAMENLLQARDRMYETRQLASTDGTYSPNYYKQQVQQIADGAAQAAWDALDALRSASSDVQAALDKALRPRKPAGVDSVLLVDRKQDITAAILNAGPDDASSIIERAAKMLQEALADGGDDGALTAYVIAGGMLDTWLAGCKVTPAMRSAAFAAALGKVQSRTGDPIPGAALVAVLSSNGAETLNTFVTQCQHEIMRGVDAAARVAAEIQVTLSGVGGTAATGAAAVQPMSASLRAYLANGTPGPGIHR